MRAAERAAAILALRKQAQDALAEIRKLTEDCPHDELLRVRPSGGMSVYCAGCGKPLGWYCPNNPNRGIPVCEYNWDTHGENCVHCGAPEERK